MKLFNSNALIWAIATSELQQYHAFVSADITTPTATGCFSDNASSSFHPGDWKYCQEIVDDTLYMYYTPLNDTIMLGLHATEGVTGWSSLAPSGNGGMKGASQLVVRKDDATGEWIAEDRHSFEYTTPSIDAQQDVQLLFAKQNDDTGETAWGVLIPQNSCDEPFDYEIEDRNMFMLWAHGNTHGFSFHGGDRGQFTANLMGPPPSTPDMDEYDHVDLLMPNVPVVRGEQDLDPTNPFICSYFDMEEMGKDIGFTSSDKVHLVGYEPVMTEGNEKLIHHLTLYICEGDVSVEGGASFEDNEGGFSGMDGSDLEHQKVLPACTSMPPGCSSFIAGWSVGAEAGGFPEDVGIPIGEGNRWLVMQMHYYNPTMIKDVYDSSGLRLYITNDLRPIDGGIMQFVVGTETGQHPPLPGGLKDVAMETLYVEPDCTNAWTEPLTILDVNHHSHFMGSHQEIIVERDGVNMGPMRKEFRYDYNHQTGLQPVNALRTLLPGDRIAASCHFDTSSVPADSEVQIGEESNKEMCFPTLFYYPKQELNTFIYFPAEWIYDWYIADIEYCSSGSLDKQFGNLCAEKLFTDIPGYYKPEFDGFGYSGPSFGYLDLCNGGDETLELRTLLEICPEECVETQTCSEELLIVWAQEVCKITCEGFGLSLFPDTSRTEVFNTANFGCPQALFNAPKLAEPAACQIKGVLPQTIKLIEVTDEDEEDVDGGSVPVEPDPELANSVPGPAAGAPPEPEPKNSGLKPAYSSIFAALALFGVLS